MTAAVVGSTVLIALAVLLLLLLLLLTLVFDKRDQKEELRWCGVGRKITTVLSRIRDTKQTHNKWEAHVLQLDVITYGESANHAIAMAEEAARMCYAHDLATGAVREDAPDSAWRASFGLDTYPPSKLNRLSDEQESVVVEHTVFVDYLSDET